MAEGSQEKGKTLWRIDYGRSSDLWRRGSGGKSLHTSFGAWKRIDDCVTDAFAFWPEESGAQSALARDFCLLGGRSEEHTSELQSLMRISYAVFCLKKKKIQSTEGIAL